MTGQNPWEKKKWHNGQIRPSRFAAVIILVMGVAFLLIGMTTALNVENALKLPLNKDNIVLLFPFVGLCMTIASVFMFLRNRKWRGSEFTMTTMPGVIGGRLSGMLILCGNLGRDTDIDITLVNEEQRTRSSGKNSHTSTYNLFKHEIRVNSAQISRDATGYALPGIGRIEVPIDIEIPFEAKDETEKHKSGRTRYTYKWKLKVKADIPGMDMNLEFVLPVYRTEASDPMINQAKKDSADAVAAVAAHQTGQLDFEEIETDRIAGSEHYISKGKYRVMLVIAFVILSIGVGIAYYSISELLPEFQDSSDRLGAKLFSLLFLLVPTLISFVFVSIGALCAAMSVYMMGTKEVWVQNGQVNYIKRLGSKQWHKTIDRDSIIDFTVKRCASSGGNNYYAVSIEHSDLSLLSRIEQFLYKKAAEKKGFPQVKVPLEIARDIDDKAEAHLLAEKIKQQLQLVG